MRIFILASVVLFLLSACSSREAVRRPWDVPRIEVVHCRLAPSNEFLDIRFRIYGAATFDPDPSSTYLIDEGTGEKYYIMLLQRIGKLAETRSPEETAVHSIMFRNIDRKLKPGARVTLVAGGLRQEHVVVRK
jgi:hypothetical protein